MKRKTSIRTVAVLVALFACLTLQAVNAITYTATYSPNKLTTGTDTLGGVTYATVAYEGLFNGGAPGTPSLPVDYLKFSVPHNATNFSVSASVNSTNTSIRIGYLVYPNQQPRLVSDTTGWSITLPDSIAYLPNVYHPTNANCAWVVDEGFLAGENHIVTVAVMPVAFYHRRTTNVDRKTIRLSHSIDLTLSYDLSDSLAIYPVIRQDTALRSEGYRLTQSLVVNPANVVTNAPTSMTPDTLIVINLGSGGGPRFVIDSTAMYFDTLHITPSPAQMAERQYQYLIVTTSEFKHSVRRLAALKQQKGYSVKVVTMDEIENHPYAKYGDLIKQANGKYAPVDTNSTGKLRQYLKLYHDFYGTKYVLLVGTEVPYKYISLDLLYHFDAPSDIYYSDLNYDWSGGIVRSDLWPELYIGRILAKSVEQIDNYTDKLYKYELNPGNGDFSYLKRAFCLEGREFLGRLQDTKDSLSNIYSNIISINDSLNNNKYPNGKNIIDTIKNNPVGFICMLNHGDTTRIRVYGYDNDSTLSFVNSTSSLTIGDGLNCLLNKDYPMIFYAPCCMTIPFDNSSGMNMGESFTTGKDYGGPVYIGYTRKVYEFPIKCILEEFVGRLKDYGFVLGKTDAFSKKHAISSSRDESVIHAFLGDPSLELWTNEPNLYSGISISRSNSSISISGINVDYTIVAFYNNDGSYYQNIFTSNNATFDDVSPNSSAMIYKHNYIPLILPMSIQNEVLDKSQYVIASDVIAGYSVDNNRTFGDVIVENGVEYEIEASGTVTLQGGFSVEQGATFAVYPSSFR